ncbi:4-hydroxy-tetrahydrodipicolinate reductase [Sphingomonas sp. Root710]|uniref:4-hydroxy-tetrahydrodipicolinate reductase n=1 Tax=Sphingomonas sp. Root710 TaxID=1736594 RepID=UPI0006F64CD7|nr:4-hydroxy-tetrahydrodipicolinate reductase [Sphingomonas sp. Root710]KRB86840.1 4-hydroxy-tetrahydrodipicolinate reductase [Sphingomonas sp. Root710]
MTRIGILGANGRMGRAIADVAADLGAIVAGGVDLSGAVFGEHRDAAALAAASDVLVDFSAPAALAGHLEAALAAKVPLVIGTTGLQPEHHKLIDDAAAHGLAVLQSANTSLGVNLLSHLVREAAARLGDDWDIEIVEMHHRHKVDAPSGTALLLGSAAAQGRGSTLQELSRYDRIGHGNDKPREAGTIGYASLRGGSVAGDHMVVLATEGERIELGHRAETRAIFARGAVKACLWMQGKPAGRYTMGDVLGL